MTSQVDLIVLGLRLAFALLLYLFLLLVTLLATRDLRAAAREEAAPEEAAHLGRLLVVESEGDAALLGKSFDLLPVTSLGRNPTNTVSLLDSYVSSDHALLSWRDGRWWLEDLKSTNGTFVNRERVRHPTEVAYGDLIQIGRTTLKLSK